MKRSEKKKKPSVGQKAQNLNKWPSPRDIKPRLIHIGHRNRTHRNYEYHGLAVLYPKMHAVIKRITINNSGAKWATTHEIRNKIGTTADV
jgi:hypothetical protein